MTTRKKVAPNHARLDQVVAEARKAREERDHDHNPPDGSNWELLCIYCHDHEHQRQLDVRPISDPGKPTAGATHTPFVELAALLKRDR